MARSIDAIDGPTIQRFADRLATDPIRTSHGSSATVSWTNGMLRRVDPNVQRALDAIETAERLVAAMPPTVMSSEYLEDIRRVMALPENQSGADKSHVWPRYAAIRLHFQSVRRVE